MNWNEIEVKWAEMARRVRSDQPNAKGRTGPEGKTSIIASGDLPKPPAPEVKPGTAS